MNRISNGLGKLMTFGVGALGACAVLFVLAMNLIWSSHVSLMEKVSIQPAGFLWLVPFALALTGLYVLLRLEKKISERWLFLALTAVYLAAGLVLIFSVTDILRADANTTYQAAQKFLNGDYSSFEASGYLGIYPQQLGVLLYDAFWGLFTANTRVLFLANLAYTIAIDWLMWRMADLLFGHDHRVNLVTIALSFAFLPQFFFIMFAYGLLVGFFFLCLGVWMLLRYHLGTGRAWWLVGGVACLVLASFFKKNYLIGLLAVAIWELVLLVKERKGRRAMVLLALALMYVGFYRAVPAVLEGATGIELYDGAPSMLWVAMGTDPANDYMCHGWYNGYNWDTFHQCNFDTELASQVAADKVKENLAFYMEHPGAALRYFGVKLASTWCEPTFGSVWSGPLDWCGQPANTALTRSLYDQGKVFWLVYHGMKGLNVLVIAAALAGVFTQRRRFEAFGLPCLYLLGGLLFHLAWETKSQYVYTYLFLFIPLCAAALAAGYSRVAGKKKQIREEAA